jgi:hypothetical protein
MKYIKTTPDEIGVPSFDIEQEAYKFATANGLGNAGVRIFYNTLKRLGKNASLVDVRKESLRVYAESKVDTEVITKTKDKVNSLTQGPDPVEIDEKYATDWRDR